MADFTVERAKEIVQAAIDTNAWEGMPEHESDLFKAAGQLVEVATSTAAKEKYPPPVKAILFAARIDPVYKMVCEEKGVPYEHQAPPAEAAPVAGAFETPEAAPAQEPAGGFDIESLIPGYDDLKVKDIKPLIAALQTAEQVDAIKAYEAENEGRAGIANFEWTPPAPSKTEPTQQTTSSSPAGDVDLKALYEGGTIGVEIAIKEGLAPPPEIPGVAPDLSIDITNLSNQDLTRYAMGYHSRLARAVLLVSREEGKAKTAETLKHDAHADAFNAAFGRLKGAIEKPTAAATTEARQEAGRESNLDKTFKLWRDRQVAHEAEAGTLKAMAEGYRSAIDRLSREQSRRAVAQN